LAPEVYLGLPATSDVIVPVGCAAKVLIPEG